MQLIYYYVIVTGMTNLDANENDNQYRFKGGWGVSVMLNIVVAT